MVVPRLTTSPEKRLWLRSLSLIMQSLAILGYFFILSYEGFFSFIMYKYKFYELLREKMGFTLFKGVAIASTAILAIFFHLFESRTLVLQRHNKLRFRFKRLSEFMMIPVLTVILISVVTVVSVAYCSKFPEALKECYLEKFINIGQDPTAARYIDQMQNDFYCCGLDQPEDYYNYSTRTGVKYLFMNVSDNVVSCDVTVIGRLECALPISCCQAWQCSKLLRYMTQPKSDDWFKKKGCLPAITESFDGHLNSSLSTVLLLFVLIIEIVSSSLMSLTLSSYSILKEAGLHDSEETVGWIFPFAYPSPNEIVQEYKETGKGSRKPSKNNVGSSASSLNSVLKSTVLDSTVKTLT